MNPQGRFTAKAHLARVAKHGRGPEADGGPGIWQKRPGTRRESDLYHDYDNEIGLFGYEDRFLDMD